MAHLPNESEAEEISENFRDVINDGSNAEKCWWTSIILKMPKEKSENKSNAKTHEPSNEKKWCAFNILELFYHSHPFGYFPRCLCEYFTLKKERIINNKANTKNQPRFKIQIVKSCSNFISAWKKLFSPVSFPNFI